MDTHKEQGTHFRDPQGSRVELKGFNDLQCVRGFIRGLNNEYKAKVKTQYPKTLEEAIKCAQIFDDTLEKSHAAKFPPTRTNVSMPTFKFNNNANKRKEVGGGTNDTKKQKVRKGKLTSEEMGARDFVLVAWASTSRKIVP